MRVRIPRVPNAGQGCGSVRRCLSYFLLSSFVIFRLFFIGSSFFFFVLRYSRSSPVPHILMTNSVVLFICDTVMPSWPVATLAPLPPPPGLLVSRVTSVLLVCLMSQHCCSSCTRASTFCTAISIGMNSHDIMLISSVRRPPFLRRGSSLSWRTLCTVSFFHWCILPFFSLSPFSCELEAPFIILSSIPLHLYFGAIYLNQR